MRILLIRHGMAEPAPPGSDRERALSEEGRDGVRCLASALRRLCPPPELIVSSPLRRGLETAEILAGGLGNVPVEVSTGLAPGTDPNETLREITAFGSFATLALVGHQPDLGFLTEKLLTQGVTQGPFAFEPGAAAAIELEVLRPGVPARLEWFVSSRHLRILGGT